jgi:hypothetical protein
MLLTASYLTPAQFLALPSDYDFDGYDTAELQSILSAASGQADAYMRRSYRAQEQTIRYWGAGRSYLELEQKPLLYVKRVQVAIPGTQGIIMPVDQILLDYEQGEMFEYTPLYWQGNLGYVFPRDVPVDVTLGWGYGATVAKAPVIAIVDQAGAGGLAPGTYNVAVTAKTFFGETTAAVQQYDTATGAFLITPTQGLGVYVYRAYASPASDNTTITAEATVGAMELTVGSIAGMAPNAQWLLGSGSTAEVVTILNAAGSTVTLAAGCTNAHGAADPFIPVPGLVAESPFVAYGSQPINLLVNSLNPPTNYYQDILPTADSSAPAMPDAIIEAVRLLSLSRIYEQNNKANRGVQNVAEGNKRLTWRSTEGNSGRGTPLLVEEAKDLLSPYALNGLYFA